MKPPIDTFWAKLLQDEEGKVLEWLPVEDHCADVAACCEVLLEEDVLRKRLAKLGGLDDLDEVQRQRLCVLAGLHDIGKYNHGFQNKRFPRSNKVVRAGHVKEVLALFGTHEKETQRLCEALRIQSFSNWCVESEKFERLLIAALSHHGRPVECGKDHQSVYWKKLNGKDPFEGIANLRNLVEDWYPKAWSSKGSFLPKTPAFQHAFNGLVILADWLGSDTGFFPLSTDKESIKQLGDNDVSNLNRRIDWSRLWARRATLHIGLEVSFARNTIDSETSPFSLICPFSPRPMQKAISELPVPKTGSLTVLEAKTGDGKTEAALARFLTLFRAGKVDGMYFALPTRTAATQIHKRVYEAMRKAFPKEEDRPPVVLAVPGYLAVDDKEGKRLPGFEVLWPDDEDNKEPHQLLRLRHRRWASENPKRFLAGSVVVGTIDQVLLSSLRVNHAHLRATALLRHLIIVDEVHASDAYMNRILEDVLKRHIASGGHAFLMSATLGAEARSSFTSLGNIRSGTSCPSYEESKNVEFPLATYLEYTPTNSPKLSTEPRTMRVLSASEETNEGDSSPRLSVTMERKGCWETPREIAAMGLKAASQGAKVLIIRNTVKDCVATQLELENIAQTQRTEDLLFKVYDQPAPHHSRFARKDRKVLDKSLEQRFGKDRDEKGCVVVATQTVQQSLDLDSDLLITDLCPIDVLLQRLGRLHRHNRHDRPSGYTQPRAIVLVSEDRDLGQHIKKDGKNAGTAFGPCGVGTVYEDLRILEATWRVLEQRTTFQIPDDCRALVEEALHPEILKGIEKELGNYWEKHGRSLYGSLLADRRTAKRALVRFDLDYGEEEGLFPSRESLDQSIKTRLGEGDRLVEFESPLISPFGNKVRRLTIAAWLAGDIAKDASPSIPEQIAPHTLTTAAAWKFSFGKNVFIYDRCGLRHADS